MKVQELIEELNKFHKKDDTILAHIWQVRDILDRAKEREISLTEFQADEILENMDRHIDCTLGVCWDTVDVFTDNFLEDLED